MELTFVNQYSGDPPKRRRLAKACETCRARKKRCIHYAGVEVDSDSNDRSGDQDTSRTGNSDDEDELSRPVSGRQAGIIDHSAHFVSDLTPASTLLKRPAPLRNGIRRRTNEDIGIWVDRREWEALVKQKHDAERVTDAVAPTRHDTRPHSAVLGPLIDIYFLKIHPILPLLDEREFRRNHVGGIVPEPLVHAMCLVAAKDPDAEPHLRVTDSADPVPPRRFCSVLHASVMGALKVPVRFEKVTLIRILALTSLHNEGPDGAEEASIHLSKAMHYAQTLGIHLGQQAAVPAANELAMKRLFWCLYALDRTNAATNGRPLLMSDVDMASERFEPGESGFPAFEAWVRIAELLNKVINFYRPTSDLNSTGWEEAYPGLEEILDEAQAWDLSPSLLATIHLFYLAVAILSHRTRGVKQIPRALASQVRQRLCALEVNRLLSNPATARQLHPLPIVPYAVSLSLSVAYQHLRQSQLEHQQSDALADFRSCCTVLHDLRRTWAAADVMAALAKKVLDELDRAPSLASFRVRRVNRDHVGAEDAGTAVAGELIPVPSACTYGLGAIGVLTGDGKGAGPATVDGGGTPPATEARGAVSSAGEGMLDGGSLFEDMDDVFGTFMDPNYPLSLEDMAFVDGIPWPVSDT